MEPWKSTKMADSDDEYHRRGGRDKFTRERTNDYSDRPRRDYDYDRRTNYQRNDYSNSTMKRSTTRREDYNGGTKRSRIDASDTFDPVMKAPVEEEQQPVMMTFKKFLSTQEDTITDEGAIAKYSEYKLEFKRQELHKFFLAHKDEEWFRLKYHPDDSKKRKNEQREGVARRYEIFESLLETNQLDKLRVDFDKSDDITRIMDILVIKLEGGTEEDFNALEQEKMDDDSAAELKKAKSVPKEKSSNVNGEEKTKGANGENFNDDGALSDSEDDKEKVQSDENYQTEETDESRQRKKMLLHKTSSIFLRNVAPTISVAEIEEVCKRFPGFLRVGLADPLPDRKFSRRGWITFRRDVNIKEICWNLNSVRIKDCDLGAIINRDLARRVRTVNGVTGHKQVAQNDLRQAAKLAALYDRKAGINQPESSEEKNSSFELDVVAQSQNPLLKNLTDFLIEEASAEEEELLGIANEGGADEDLKVQFHRDENLIERLDRIIIYLRLVHSIDFYNHGEYPNEDVMPNRCGMMHVRSSPPSPTQWGADENGNVLVAQKFINDFIASFNSSLESTLMSEAIISEAEIVGLGKKDPETEIEAFITANCVELAKDKWLCPLSGKKFKGPEFIRKHLATKHIEKLDQVRHEAEYFNNYLSDPKRPQNQEVKPQPVVTQPTTTREDRRERENFEPDRPRPINNSYNDRERRTYGGGRYGGNTYGGGRNYDRGGTSRYWEASVSGRRDPREPVTYKDLDAPEDVF